MRPNSWLELSSRRSVGTAAEPPRAAPTARRHAGCIRSRRTFVSRGSRRAAMASAREAARSSAKALARPRETAHFREYIIVVGELLRTGARGRSPDVRASCQTIALPEIVAKTQATPAARSPSQRRKVRNRPRPAKRAATEATLWALDPFTLNRHPRRSSAHNVASPPVRRTLVAARSSRAARPSAFGHRAACHSGCSSLRQSCHSVSLQPLRPATPWPRRAPPAPSLLPPVQVGDWRRRAVQPSRFPCPAPPSHERRT
jgi:hypothetical protein